MGIALLELAYGPVQVIRHIQEGLHGVQLGIGIDALLLLGGALTIVVVLGGQAKIFIVAVAEELCQTLKLLHLLPADGEGLLHLRHLRRFLCRGLLSGLRGGLLRLLHILFLFFTHFLFSSPGGSSRGFSNIRLRLSAK